MQTLCVLGRQPALGVAELESLYGPEPLRVCPGVPAVVLNKEPAQIDFSRLGGTVKFCKILTVLDSQQWSDIQKFLETAIPQHLQSLPEGKLKLGLSVIGLQVSVNQINATALQLKKLIKATGQSVRVIPNTEPALNSAQVLHNQLTSALGWELVFVADGAQTIVAQNIAEQDIEAYARRDQARPKRDAKVGMLPPKLAQIIVNLAAGRQPTTDTGDMLCGPAENKGLTVLDPFCGTGVVLQEAALMGYDAYGTDLEQRMIDYSHANLDWLGERANHPPFTYWLDAADATDYQWHHPFDFVAAEAYLGRPFSAVPKPEVLAEVKQDVNLIIHKFLKNLAAQTKPGLRLCIAVPAWEVNGRYQHLKTLDSLEEIGYTRLSFEHAEADALIYHRPGQVVGRELLVLTRK